MTTPADIENEIENLLIGKLNSEEMSELRTLLGRYYDAAFNEGREAEREEPPDRNEGRD